MLPPWHWPNAQRVFYTLESVQKYLLLKDNRPEATTIYTPLFFFLSFCSFRTLELQSSSSPGGGCSWHKAHEPNENVYLQSAGGGVFALCLCRDLIWICLMCTWNSKCQPGGRWVGMCSEAWCLNTRETTK